ncbi:unnamed protein product [Coffea canephora]|uniref:Uncharacterized protein n=1 Tax=Coffea canephora TaxID=49390 RepID=A0A068UI10_COFCA|nr:unnamed protein product [Coffea canephora]
MLRVGKDRHQSVLQLASMFRHIDGDLDECHKIRSGSIQSSDASSQKKETTNTLIDILIPLLDTEPEFLTHITIKSIILSLLTSGTETTSNTWSGQCHFCLTIPKQ